MDERIIIRRMNAGRPSGNWEFPVLGNRELLIGRDEGCKIRFDENQDDLVSRRHAKINVDSSDPVEASITDLGSSNGTFVNRQRVFNSTRLNPGDIVQLGAGGPEFQYDFEPKPVGPKATRMAGIPSAAPTRQTNVPGAAAGATAATVPAAPIAQAQGYGAGPIPPPSGSTTVGKATVERMITQNKNQTRNQMLMAGLALLLILGATAGFLLTRKQPKPVNTTTIVERGPTDTASTDIAEKFTPAVIYIEAEWSLVDGNNGHTLSQVTVPNIHKDAKGQLVRWTNTDVKNLPMFVVKDGKAEPILTTDDGGGAFLPVGGNGQGSGFIVSSDGFAITNRHVATSWNAEYGWRGASLALLYGAQKDPVLFNPQQLNWIPSQAKIIVEGALDASNIRAIEDDPHFAKTVQGRNDALNVTFPHSSQRAEAKVSRVSEHADVAMIKIDLPKSLTKVDLFDNYSTIKPGARITVMGYPAIAPDVVQVAGSVDILNQKGSMLTVPDPTVTSGNIGRVLRSSQNANTDTRTVSTMGDVYQLQINTVSHGNSGGPVFDDHGRVIGIFTSGTGLSQNGGVTFALPIRYGLELMGESPS